MSEQKAHEIIADWTCCCGEDCFGGTVAYSRMLWDEHLRASGMARKTFVPSEGIAQEALAALGYADPRWLDAPCARCGADIGHLCTSESGRMTLPHSSRYKTTQPVEAIATQVVFGQSRKYHRLGCPAGPYRETCSDPVDVSIAKQLRLAPCQRCRPHEDYRVRDGFLGTETSRGQAW